MNSPLYVGLGSASSAFDRGRRGLLSLLPIVDEDVLSASSAASLSLSSSGLMAPLVLLRPECPSPENDEELVESALGRTADIVNCLKRSSAPQALHYSRDVRMTSCK